MASRSNGENQHLESIRLKAERQEVDEISLDNLSPNQRKAALVQRFDSRRILETLTVCVNCGMAWTNQALLFNPICDRCFQHQGGRRG